MQKGNYQKHVKVKFAGEEHLINSVSFSFLFNILMII